MVNNCCFMQCCHHDLSETKLVVSSQLSVGVQRVANMTEQQQQQGQWLLHNI